MGIRSWVGKRIRLTDGGFWSGFFGMESHSGETVNLESMLALDAAWACVKLMSGTVKTLPCVLYDNETMEPARGEPLYDIIHDVPNADDTAVEFWEAVVFSLMVYGNAFGEVKRNGAGDIVAIYLIPAEKVKVERTPNRNERIYRVTENGNTRTLTERQVFHPRMHKIPGCDVGLSPLAYGKQAFGNAIAAEKTAGKMFANGMQAAGVLSADQILNEQQRAQIAEMVAKYAGSDRAGKLMVLEAGLKYQQLSLTPEDAQMLDTRRFGVEQVCRYFGVPPVMIGHAAAGVTTWGSGVEQIILQFTKTGLASVLRALEGAIARDLMDRDQRSRFSVKFNMEGLLRGDSASRKEFISGMVQNGVYTRNHARRLENLPPSPDKNADVLTVQSNLVPLGLLGQAQPVAAPAQNQQDQSR